MGAPFPVIMSPFSCPYDEKRLMITPEQREQGAPGAPGVQTVVGSRVGAASSSSDRLRLRSSSTISST